MKTCLSLFLLLLVTSVINAQYLIQHNQSKEIQNPPANNSSPDYECIAPTDFDAHVYTIGYDQYMVYLTWDMQNIYGEWLHWDEGVNYSGIGCCYDISAAVRWDSGQLVEYHNFKIAKMRVILNDTANDSLVFKIWNGEHESDLIYLDTIDEFYAGSWIEHELESDLYLNSNEELYIGYTALGMPAGTFTLGTDDGPAIAGYGDLIRPDNNYNWDLLSDYGLEYNWNIQFYAEDTNGNQKQVGRNSSERNINFIGYKLYHSKKGGEYELLEFIPSENDSNYYALPLDASTDLNCFKLTGLWTTLTDTCESAPAISRENPTADSVCVLLVGQESHISDKMGTVQCFPNPFTTATTLSYTLKQPSPVQFSVYNQLGQLVYQQSENQSQGTQQLQWDAQNQPEGMYYFTLQAGKQVSTGKMVLAR